MMTLLRSLFSEQVSVVMEYLHTIASIGLAVATIYTSILASSLFLPKVRLCLGLINKLFGVGLLLSILGGAAFIYYLTPPARVVYVEPPKPVQIDFPDLPDLPDLPDIPVDAVARSASDALDAVATVASESIEEIGKALTLPGPTPEMMERMQERQRIAQRNSHLQTQLNNAHQRLIQSLNQFGHTGYGFGGLGLYSWQSRYQTNGRRALRARRDRMERQLKAATDNTANQFQLVEDQLFDAIHSIYHGHNLSRPNSVSDNSLMPFNSIAQRVNDCKEKAWEEAERRRDQMHRINPTTIHGQVAQWRSLVMRKELRHLADKLRSEWVEQVNSTYGVNLR